MSASCGRQITVRIVTPDNPIGNLLRYLLKGRRKHK
jgi:hypothetical protein